MCCFNLAPRGLKNDKDGRECNPRGPQNEVIKEDALQSPRKFHLVSQTGIWDDLIFTLYRV